MCVCVYKDTRSCAAGVSGVKRELSCDGTVMTLLCDGRDAGVSEDDSSSETMLI